MLLDYQSGFLGDGSFNYKDLKYDGLLLMNHLADLSASLLR